jgi:hypothetical protein
MLLWNNSLGLSHNGMTAVGALPSSRHTKAPDVHGALVRPSPGSRRLRTLRPLWYIVVPGMKQSHEFRTREASNPNDWLRARLVAPEFHCGVPR